MEIFEILCGIVAVILLLYYYLTSTFDFWQLRGVRGPRPMPIFGNLKDILFGKISWCNYLMKLCEDYKTESVIGIFAQRTPVLVVKDLDLVKDILIKDFPTFADRGFTIHEKSEPLSQHLFNLEPKRWRPLRTKLSHMFTPHKLKKMFSLILECSDHLLDYMEKLVSKNESIECLELMAKYTTDIIGNCVFGVEINSMSNKNSEFRRIGRNVFHPPWSDLLRAKIKVLSPRLYDILGYILPDTEITSFFTRLVVDTMDYRDKNNIVRNDFIDMLRELKKHSDKMDEIEFTDSMLASQAFLFYAAGFETSSTTMANILYELALHQKIQDKLREEIDEKYVKYDGIFTYENIKTIEYFDKVFKETLRKYPPGMFYERKTTSSYTFNNAEKIHIPKGQKIWIPVFVLQHDPCVYPDPEVFDPERFNEEAVKNRHPMSFISFGDGPRNCIGSRFAICQSKLGLIKILRNYKFEPCEKTDIPYALNYETIIASPKNGIHLRIIKINRA
ncbi:PREDICTED: probable cytochrome P450 6a13 [Vollenhovia emeryi]|uniref:probable cytochrome P450 6a13 n=1 Tax=Vollenhovia emeryi TaxID=411798 RepID=UPI0005F4E9D7|nr:PREDICTED: probable cytochrome P450 6a13 [Vollenhovia emeryi]XP_011865155.1 PREDICTED: probable cytochrome P450 6a13 [Vollenhovia emeryi]